jgi:hypothetical protein
LFVQRQIELFTARQTSNYPARRQGRDHQTQPDSLAPSANESDMQMTPDTAASVEIAAAAVTLIDKSDVTENGQVHAHQHVGQDEALAMVTEFAKFVIARIHDGGNNIIVTITGEDADLFRSLRNRAQLAIRTEPVAHSELSHWSRK